MDKQSLRLSLLEERLSLSLQQVQDFSKSIQERLMKSAFWPKAGKIGLYASVKNEVLTADLFQKALECGLHVYFPRVEQGIHFYEVNGPDDLQRGSWSIPEPKQGCLPLEDETLDLLVLPGLGFSQNGHRLGYGKGFYDHYIFNQKNRPTFCVGLAYQFQLIENLPHETHDQPMDAVLTEKNTYNQK